MPDITPRTDDFGPAQAHARAWLQENAQPRPHGSVDHVETAEQLAAARKWQQQKLAGGWAGLTWPKVYGGQGQPVVNAIMWDLEAAQFDVPEEAFIVSNMLAGPTIIDVGTEEQKAFHLAKILDGQSIWCQLFSEPSAGSDLAAVSARAVRDGDDWVVTGQKVWNSGAHYADWGLLLARTDPTAGKHAGLSMFLLDMRSPGLTVRGIKQITGATHFNEVFLDQVRIPDSHLLGAAGEGWKVARTVLTHERVGLMSRRRVDVSDFVDMMSAAAGGDLADAPADIRQAVADICMRAEAIRLLNVRLLRSVVSGAPPGPESSVGKIASARLLNDMARLTTSALGPLGMLDGDDAPYGGRWQHAFLDATARRIAGGSDEIQRNIIAENVLGLPRDRTSSTRSGVQI